MADYFDELIRTMEWLGQQEKVKFIGQSVEWDGHALFKSMKLVPMEKRLELPVFEDFQMGMSIGLAFEGWIPINIYPRSDFLIIAANQIANHLSNVRYVTDGKLRPRVITRVSVGGTEPMHPGVQHCQDYTEAIRVISKGEINIVELTDKRDILPAYQYAVTRKDSKPTILVEYMDLYHTQKVV
jgi:pyruvate/2-oxoglutarate/acetoin dehydrogenase E1 component